MKMKKKLIVLLTLVMTLAYPMAMQAEEVTVTILTDNYTEVSKSLVETMQRNLGRLLSEINTSDSQNKPQLNLANSDIPESVMSPDAKGMLNALWDNIHFSCDDAEVVDKLWPMKNGFMVRQIPLIINPQGETFGHGNYQEATVDFDKNGRIVDFQFVFDSQLSESMERCGSAVDMERKLKILKFCDKFATYYNTKRLDKLQEIFSDDALIITGNVTQVYHPEAGVMKPKVTYKKQTKTEYLSNLRRTFARNKYIDVKFTEIGEGGGCGPVTVSANNPNMYGVRLHQAWRSSNYSDDGYVFLLWEFRGEDDYILHVRTWQPEYLDKAKTQPLPQEEVFSLSDFDL